MISTVKSFHFMTVSATSQRMSNTWARLHMEKRVFAYVPYGNSRVKIHREATTSTDQCKYFCHPICTLEPASVESRFNAVQQLHEVRFRIHFYDSNLEEAIVSYLHDHVGQPVNKLQVQVMPFDRVILTSSSPTRNYSLLNQWVPYGLEHSLWFSLICDDKEKADHLAGQLRERPDQFSNLRLGFTLSPLESTHRETAIAVDSIVTCPTFIGLQQKLPSADSVLLSDQDTERLLCESVANVVAQTFADNEIPAVSSLYSALKKVMVSARETISKDSEGMLVPKTMNRINLSILRNWQLWKDIKVLVSYTTAMLITCVKVCETPLSPIAGQLTPEGQLMERISKSAVTESNKPCFAVYRKSQYKKAGSNVTYEVADVNHQGAMNLETGVFTAPREGVYFFTFNAFAATHGGSTFCRVYIYRNETPLAHAYSACHCVMMPVSRLMSLDKGDRVSVWLKDGVLWDHGDECFIQFSGFFVSD